MLPAQIFFNENSSVPSLILTCQSNSLGWVLTYTTCETHLVGAKVAVSINPPPLPILGAHSQFRRPLLYSAYSAVPGKGGAFR